MTDLLKTGVEWLAQARAAFCASPVTYRRGSASTSLSATLGQTEFEVEDDYGLRTTFTSTDFILSAADFPYVEPAPGDEIVSGGQVYTVMSPLGQGHFRWCDPYHTMLRIHAKVTGTAT